jgi:anti-repressor protein
MDMQPDNDDPFPEGKATNDIVPFFFEGARVRTVIIDGELHFVGIDVCERLGYANPSKAMSDHCRGITRRYPIVDALGRVQKARVLSEPDVLRLIVKSHLPEADRFERWVFEEVLPAVRKTGGYMIAAPDETPEALALRALTVLQATVERQKAQLATALPKADALDRIATADGSLNITEAAKALQRQPKDLFADLATNGWTYIRAGSGTWLGYQARTNAGDLVHKVETILQAGDRIHAPCSAHLIRSVFSRTVTTSAPRRCRAGAQSSWGGGIPVVVTLTNQTAEPRRLSEAANARGHACNAASRTNAHCGTSCRVRRSGPAVRSLPQPQTVWRSSPSGRRMVWLSQCRPPSRSLGTRRVSTGTTTGAALSAAKSGRRISSPCRPESVESGTAFIHYKSDLIS